MKLVNRFNTSIPKMPKPEKVAKDIVEEMTKFREYIPIIRSICNPGLKERHFDDIKNLIEKRIEKSRARLVAARRVTPAPTPKRSWRDQAPSPRSAAASSSVRSIFSSET